MKTNCFKCHRPITGRQKHIQHLPDQGTHLYPSEKIRDYHLKCEPKAPTGWSRWDTTEHALSQLFQIG